ncbi:MAG: hypothetical protein RL099_608, partial [Bacteroidota bacterium]
RHMIDFLKYIIEVDELIHHGF